MKLQLTPLQIRILVKLRTAEHLDLSRLVEALMPSYDMTAEQRGSWNNEIRLQIDLMRLYGLIQVVDLPNMCVCSATRAVVEWMPRHLQRSTTESKKYRPSILLPLLATSMLAPASTGCSILPGMAQNQPATVVSRYNAEGIAPPERMEQFYNPRTGSMVYRFCVGAECPEPTPKKPIARMPVTTEIGPDGRAMPPEPLARLPTTQPNPIAAAPAAKSTPRTAGNDPAAAAITTQLNAQRAALQKTAGIEPTPTAPQATPKTSVKTMIAPTPVVNPARPTPTAPDTPSQPVEPAHEKPMRAPSAPQATAPSPDRAKLAAAPSVAKAEPAGGITHRIMVTETTETSTEKTSAATISLATPAEFVANWVVLWESKNADQYFGLYAADFWPTYGAKASSESWKKQRRKHLERDGTIKVNVQIVKAMENDNKATVRFWQIYQSSTFKSRVFKSLELVKFDGDWKIRREHLIPV